MKNIEKSRPFNVNGDDYPFRDNWVDYNGAALHYVDEGSGTPVLMLHGNPTWSYLYRHIIKSLSPVCRTIAPDYPGFGFSEHPAGYGYTPREHADAVLSLMDHLKLDRCILVVQDWGGPIGLSIAVEHPERISGMVLCNSWCWPPMLNARIFSWIMGGPLGPMLQLHFNVFASVMVPAGIHSRSKKTTEVLETYKAPFPTPQSRMGTLVFPRSIRKESRWLSEIEQKLCRLSKTPVRMVWAMKDPAFGSESYIKRWKTHFPDAPVHRIEHASHYLQEDSPEPIVESVTSLLNGSR